MKVLIAPDAFKGSLTAIEVAKSLEKGLKKASTEFEIEKVPMADGGEGTVRSLVDATNGQIMTKEVVGPLGDKVEAYLGILGDQNTAVIEMAAASGLPLVPKEKRDPTKTTTYGTGELIKYALDKGCRNLIIGIGGSATNDCGVGMAQALGVKFLNAKGKEVGFGGEELENIEKIDLANRDPRIKETTIQVACDVDNPLYGKEGAAYVYGAQKGATPEMIEKLDQGLQKVAQVIKLDLGIEINDIPGAGAAGGLGAGLLAFLNANLKSGIDIVLDTIAFSKKVKDVDFVITGEGMIDSQTIYGKTPIGVAKVAKKYSIPVIGIAGSLDSNSDEIYQAGIDALFSIIDRPMKLETAMKRAPILLAKTGENIGRLVKSLDIRGEL
ncbi:glycerate kinase [Halobacteroides halobius DSM 5150]|uniref:Glycerate kinase n=1 Tax=Halobacteroides halobius (strain ATCC 35273 / DSM 5150 / MD-1) TaxID=748449 RepID=L0K8X3_HALHC|nr:glycerate kinase [Halobacteroides halobius]AGB40995.1 glycerate kinase [Halobacteroides halobius DSM 5150]